jgi:hypothetical protein
MEGSIAEKLATARGWDRQTIVSKGKDELS